MCSVFNILNGELFATTSVEVSAVFEALGSPTLLCILGSRMLFNLKEAAEHGVNIGTNWSSYTHTISIDFEEQQTMTEDIEYVICLPAIWTRVADIRFRLQCIGASTADSSTMA